MAMTPTSAAWAASPALPRVPSAADGRYFAHYPCWCAVVRTMVSHEHFCAGDPCTAKREHCSSKLELEGLNFRELVGACINWPTNIDRPAPLPAF